MKKKKIETTWIKEKIREEADFVIDEPRKKKKQPNSARTSYL